MNEISDTLPQGDAVVPPWWRVGMVWLVLSGPAVVVVAGVVVLMPIIYFVNHRVGGR